MSKTLVEISEKLTELVDKEVSQSKDFGLEFGTFSQEKLKATVVKNIVVSPYMNLKLVHFMNENDANLIVTIQPLSLIEKGFPLSERDFELLKALIQNNLRTFKLSDEWVFSQNGGLIYFLQTLGITKFSSNKITSPSKFINYWSLPSVKFKDFLSSLTHLCKNWNAYSYSNDEPLKIVLENLEFDEEEISLLKEQDVNTIISFKNNSRKTKLYQEHRMNFLFIPFIDYCNIALRKFSQILQLKTETKVIFYPQEILGRVDFFELK